MVNDFSKSLSLPQNLMQSYSKMKLVMHEQEGPESRVAYDTEPVQAALTSRILPVQVWACVRLLSFSSRTFFSSLQTKKDRGDSCRSFFFLLGALF